MRKIITEHVYPPIPVRRFDWLAYYDGMEDSLTGTGSTEAEAIADLVENNDSGVRPRKSRTVRPASRTALAVIFAAEIER